MYSKILSTIFFLWGLFLRTTLAGSVSKQVSTISWGSRSVHSFSLHADGYIYHQWYGDTSGIERLNRTGWSSPPEAVSWGPGRIDLFALGPENSCYYTFWDGDSWNDWQNLGGNFTSSIKAVTWGTDRIDLFGREADLRGYHNWFDGREWQAVWAPLDRDPNALVPLNSGIEAISPVPSQLQIFALASDNSCVQNSWINQTWSGWIRLGGNLTGPSEDAERIPEVGLGSRDGLKRPSRSDWIRKGLAP
ncbi:hypothetical protein DL768_003659 [Monosporascus sp. mg162]|nr:hypothetical protein DL768_003659 [Monosporascus sp. mg162]